MRNLNVKTTKTLLLTYLKEHGLILVIILVVTLFFKGYQLEQRFAFEWDQERDAQMMWQMLRDFKPTLIGPRVVGPTGFFLGPLWYYILLPFYFIFKLDPIASAVAALFSGLVTTLAVYILTEKWFGKPTGIAAGLWWATLSDRTAWNPMLIPLCTILVLFVCKLILSGKVWASAVIGLLIGLALQLHFQAVFYFVPWLLALFYFYKQRKKFLVKPFLLSIGLLIMTFLPLLVFDLRHEWVNVHAAVSFFSQESNKADVSILQTVINTFQKYAVSISFILPKVLSSRITIGFLLLVVGFLGIWLSKLGRQMKIIISSLLVIPPLVFGFYKGEVSEYYFSVSIIAVVLGAAFLLQILWQSNLIGRAMYVSILLLIVGISAKQFLESKSSLSLTYKKQSVSHIVNQKQDPIFNVSYSVPMNFDNGFRYLFKWYGREPVDTSDGHLWSIVIPPDSANVKPDAVFGGIGVIRR